MAESTFGMIELAWVMLTTGLFLLVFFAPRFVATGYIQLGFLEEGQDNTKPLEEYREILTNFLHNVTEIIVAILLIGFPVTFAYSYIEPLARDVIYFVEIIAIVLFIVGMFYWMKYFNRVKVRKWSFRRQNE